MCAKRILLINKRICFAVVGKECAVHFWVEPNWNDNSRSWGGVEVHKRPRENETPDNEDCWLLSGPCVHDGSSLYASEVVIPRFHECCDFSDGNYEAVWNILEAQLSKEEIAPCN